MLPNSQLHLLKQIERRRRYRNWVTALQLAMVVFFGDQILKTWVGTHLEVGQARVVYRQLAVTRVPRKGFFEDKVASIGSRWATLTASAIPGVIFVLLILALWLRLPDSGLGELCTFATAVGGSAGNLLSLSLWGTVTATLRLSFTDKYYLLFNLADIALVVGGVLLLRSLTARLLAEMRWVLGRQS